LIYIRINGEILLQGRHIAGLIMLIIPLCLLFFRHKLGVIALGILILVGLFGIISYSPAIDTITVGKNLDSDKSVTFLYFQPIFLVWAVLHFAISGRYYTGILSKRYWTEIKSDEPLKTS
jgi:hypothetical protein